MLLTYTELSEEIGISKNQLNMLCSRAEMAKYDTTVYTDRSWQRGVYCTKESMNTLYELIKLKPRTKIDIKRFAKFCRKLEDK